MSSENTLKAFEQTWLPKINNFLDKNIAADTDQDELESAMQYSVDAGGKRLRPLLVLSTLQTINFKINDSALKVACGLELLHTYSLIHDDLPAMDNDDLRRGKPTNHKKFGAGMATLAGDGLQALAIQWTLENNLNPHTSAELALNLCKAAGPKGMVSGQADDIQFEGTRLNYDGLKKLHRHKTGALIHYAVEAGLIIGNVPLQNRKYLLKFADEFGLAFQIYDDLLDVIGDEKTLGKPVHQDKGKNTYPNLFGLDKTKTILIETVDQARQSLKKAEQTLQLDTSLLNSFCDYFKIKDEK